MIFAWFTAARLFLSRVPEIVWPILALAAIVGGVLLWDRWDDAQVVKRIETERAAVSAEAGQQSAEERADAAIKNVMAEQARETAIAKAEASEAAKPVEQRSTQSAYDLALACERLRQAKHTDGPNYKRNCQ